MRQVGSGKDFKNLSLSARRQPNNLKLKLSGLDLSQNIMNININTQNEINSIKNQLETQWLKVKMIAENDEPDSGDLLKTLQTIKELEGAMYYLNALEVS